MSLIGISAIWVGVLLSLMPSELGLFRTAKIPYLSSHKTKLGSRMRCILFLTIILTSCSTTQKLPSGQWSGYFSSMDKADNRTTLSYEVDHREENVSLQIFGPRGMNIQTKLVEMTKDTLFFSFDKQNQTGTFSCALKKVNKNYYYGKCTDAEGRWAVFTMKHNSLDFSRVGHQLGSCPCHSQTGTGN